MDRFDHMDSSLAEMMEKVRGDDLLMSFYRVYYCSRPYYIGLYRKLAYKLGRPKMEKAVKEIAGLLRGNNRLALGKFPFKSGGGISREDTCIILGILVASCRYGCTGEIIGSLNQSLKKDIRTIKNDIEKRSLMMGMLIAS